MNDDELKEYSPTVMGFASSLLDKLGINFIPAGRNTWYSTAPKEDTLTDLGGKPSKDTRTSAERNTDYLNSPYLRWKTSMLNGTNPLVGISRTAVPAAEGALAITGILSIPQLVNLIKVARSTPHGVLNLAINAATLAATGTAGATVGNYVDKQLGGDGSIGSFAFGLGSIHGLNKTPFMKDFNQALTRKALSNQQIDDYITDRGGREIYVPKSLHRKLDILIGIQTGDALLLHFKDAPGVEMHLGGGTRPITKYAKIWQLNNFKDAPSGIYISSFGEATSRPQRISLNGVVKELFSKEPLITLDHNPITVDGYRTTINTGNHSGYKLDWSDNYYLTGFHNYDFPKDVLFRKLYDTFLKNPNTINLNNLNKYIVEIGGKPAKYINGELKIPFPIIYKQ